MKRTIVNNLISWKESAFRKPLIVNGARQVGKTYVIKEFGEHHYDKFIYVSLDRDEEARTIFKNNKNPEKLLRLLSAHTSIDITPGDTLVFLDEIQDCPKAIECLKYFCEDAPDYHIIVAGSLLGLSLHENISFPVGKVDIIKMYPMTFQEFVMANGKTLLADALANHDWEIIDNLHTMLIDLLRQYYYVGGMPEAVKTYIEGRGFQAVRTVQNNILLAYRRDFSKHAPSREIPRINMVWDSVPSQLAKDNKKFIYGALKKGGRATEFELAIQWLIDAGLVYKVQRVSDIKLPLKFYEDFTAFKLFMLDVGLMGAMMEVPSSSMLVNNKAISEYKGAFTELYVYTQFAAAGIPTYYHSVDKSTIEIDFAIQIDSEVYPVEVKAEQNVQAKALKTFMKKHTDLKAIRISMLPHKQQDWLLNLPLYLCV